MADAPAAASLPATIDAALDALIAEHAQDPDVTAAARREYEDRRGKVHQDEELWERWSAAFVEWFVIERIGPGADGPPALATWRRLHRAADPGAAALAALLRSHRSIFEVEHMGAGVVGLVDLLGGAQFQVDEPRVLHGVDVGDLVEMRLVGLADQVVFARTFIFHPTAARAAILEQARHHLARGAARRDIVDLIASLRVKITRYRHVAPARVYELGSKVGV